MKVLLTHGYFLADDPKEQAIMKPYVPLGILYISSWLEQHNIENKVFDSTFQTFDLQLNYIRDYRPNVIALYTNLMTKLNVLRLVKAVKADPELKHIPVILGGPEVRNHAENFLQHGADILVVGEGEETVLEVVKHLENTGKLPENIDGTAILKDGKLQMNAERKLVRDINQLPSPNRKKVDLKLYLNAWKERHGYNMVSVSTMRGCPYTCKWCSRAVYGGTYRRRSPALVVDELTEIMRDYNPDRIWFVDDVFTISHKWLQEFADEIERRQLKVNYEIISRADRMSDEVIALLKKSGCFRVWIGAESGSQRIIDAMDRRVDVQQVRTMIRQSRKQGIEAGTFIMLGYPGETRADIKETIRHLVESAPDLYTITIAYPIKGTRLYEEVESKITSSLNWAESTDREIDFSRTYSRRYYEYAVRWVYNAVGASRTQNPVKKLYLNGKGLVAQVLMQLNG
ncbi:MAG: B12-binding domain-containing radical SAM protein [Bacteroidia bacterium]